ncbi:hypothetical protein B0A50_05697 [Salinomyces thailandicus]|uniref:Uncharacterized protein n=1 Tax=Salinomyces thailandicus TaxID=706561 RepID=A0A4V5N5A7_9PEZI|nr:hypothetical protein B0A50_05697 [Salinomyces thailandica]
MPALPPSSPSVFQRLTGRRPHVPDSEETTATSNPRPDGQQQQQQQQVHVPVESGGRNSSSGSPRLLPLQLQPQPQPQPQPQHKRDSSILSLPSSVTDLGHNVRRSVSLRSHRTRDSGGSSSGVGQRTSRYPASSGNLSSKSPPLTSPIEAQEPEPLLFTRQQSAPQPPRARARFSLSSRSLSHRFKSTDTLPWDPTQIEGSAETTPPVPTIEPPRPPFGMLAAPKRAPLDRPILHTQASFPRDTSTSHGPSLNPPLPPTSAPSTAAGNPNTIYQTIHETAAKRMATIDYIRKAHDGNIFYFNTLHYPAHTLPTSLPSLAPHKLGRRATSYLVLGHSLPVVLDLTATASPIEYLKTLSALLQEFETYQSLSGFDASSGSSLSRARVGQMFKTGMGLGGRSAMRPGRRSSAATDSLSIDTFSSKTSTSTTTTNNTATNNSNLGIPSSHPSDTAGSPQDVPSPIAHDFQFLLTPHLPFEPDFSTTFATLCDTLIETYGNLLSLVETPEVCTPGVGEAFAKADKVIRKILVANVVREFEDATRSGVKSEVAGLGKLVLGPLV